MLALNLSYIYEDKKMMVYNTAVIFLFNFIDSKVQGSKEVDSFKNILIVDEKCTKISTFVDRLLPKHVGYSETDPRDDHQGRESR